MLFNSLAFIVFLPIVFALYWALQKYDLRLQNSLLLIASYIFYGWWDYRFLSLIFISSLADYLIGAALMRHETAIRRKLLLLTSLGINLGLLGVFKYYNFFAESFADLLTKIGFQANPASLNIVLPVGISFYTFQTLSYTIDIYRRKITATRNLIDFFAFVSFFPQLVAGPIERAKSLLPQFEKYRTFDLDQAKDGLRQMLWGMAKKVVIADNVAAQVDLIYANHAEFDGSMLVIGTFFFAIQIYCDFSGYSDIAIGTARLLGFKIMRNFAFPYFARDIAEFWRRWHISLSTWFRDYVYIPLGGSRSSTSRRMFNIIVTFTVSGFWHGANWTFIFWGLLHGLYFIPIMLFSRQKRNVGVTSEGRFLPRANELLSMAITFVMVLFTWIFFRAESMTHALQYIEGLFRAPFIDPTYWHGQHKFLLGLCIALLSIEWVQRDKQHALEIGSYPVPVRWAIYLPLALIVLLIGNFGAVDFIYFQF